MTQKKPTTTHKKSQIILLVFAILLAFTHIYLLPPCFIKFFKILYIFFIEQILVGVLHELAHYTIGNKLAKKQIMHITSWVHVDCDCWSEFENWQIKTIAIAGPKAHAIASIPFLLTILTLIDFFGIILFLMITGNLIPLRWSLKGATDGYWYLHPEELQETDTKK